MQETEIFKDPKIRKACAQVLQVAISASGRPSITTWHGTEYYKLPFMKQNMPGQEALAKRVSGWLESGLLRRIGLEACRRGMVNMWKEIGVNVKMNVLPSAQYWDHWMMSFATNWTSSLGTWCSTYLSRACLERVH